MNLKKLTSWLLSAVMVISLMPMAAFAENIPSDSGSDTSYEEQLDEKETEAASSEEEQPAEPTAAELVQAKIDALPAAEDLADITPEEAAELNSTVTAISLEIDALTEEEKATLVMDKIIAVAGFLATYVAPAANTSLSGNASVNAVWWQGVKTNTMTDDTGSVSEAMGTSVKVVLGCWVDGNFSSYPLEYFDLDACKAYITTDNSTSETEVTDFTVTKNTNVNVFEFKLNAMGNWRIEFKYTGNNEETTDDEIVSLYANVTEPQLAVSGVAFDGSNVEYYSFGDTLSGSTAYTSNIALFYGDTTISLENISMECSANTGETPMITLQSSDIGGGAFEICANPAIDAGTYTVKLTADMDGNNDPSVTFNYKVDKVGIKYQKYVDGTPEGELTWYTPGVKMTLNYANNTSYKLYPYCVFADDTSSEILIDEGNIVKAEQGNKNAKIVFNRDDDGYYIVYPGKQNGETSLDLGFKYSQYSEAYIDFEVNVNGYVAVVDEASWYKDATIITATSLTEDILVSQNAPASLSEEDTAKGFFVQDGKVYFNFGRNADTTATNYDIEVNGGRFSVVYMPTTFADVDERRIAPSEVILPINDFNGSATNGYYSLNYDNQSSQKWYVSSSNQENFKLIMAGNPNSTNGNEFYPVYVAKFDENGNIVSAGDRDELRCTAGNGDWIEIIKEDIDPTEGVLNVFRVSVCPPEGLRYVPTMSIKGTFDMFVDGYYSKTFEFETYKDDFRTVPISNMGEKYGIAQAQKRTLSEMQHYVPNDASMETVKGTAFRSKEFVILKGTGFPIVTDNALFDEIDISTFKVGTSNDKIRVEYITKDYDDDNCIGFRVIAPHDEIMAEEMYVEFYTKATSTESAKKYFFYGPIVCAEEFKLESTTEEVETVDEFIDAYYKMNSGTIKIAGVSEANPTGTYRFTTPFIHTRPTITIQGADTENKPVFYGSTAVLGPVITVEGGLGETIKDIIVDGEGNRVGIYGSKGDDGETFTSFSVSGVVVRNCTTAVVNDANWGDVRVVNCEFENNDIALHSKNYPIGGHSNRFVNNDVAIRVDESVTLTPRIINSNFINNTTDVNTAYPHNISLQQNFFGDANSTLREPIIVAADSSIADKVNYSPFYIDKEKTKLNATLDSAEIKESAARVASTTYLLPVDLTVNPASEMLSDVFADIKNKNEDIEISVTSDDGAATWQYNGNQLSENFTIGTDSLDIAVSDSLSDTAGTTVTNKAGDATVYQEVNFAHSGYLPGDARITVDGKYAEDAATAELYLYHVVDGKLVLEEDAAVTVIADSARQKNYYSFTSDHCSEYIISTKIVVEESGDNTGDGGTGGEGEADGTTGGGAGSTGGSTSGSSSSSSSASTATPAPTATPAAPAQSAAQATPTVNDFVSALDVEEKLEASATGEAVIDITGKDLVSSKAFEVLAENPDKTLVFETDGFKWTFAASDITDANAISGTTFKPAISLDSPNVDEIKALAGDAAEGFTHIYFQHHGKLPGKAKVEIFVGKADAGVTKHVYHYLPERGGFEYMGTTVITQDGWAAFEIYGCSDYILSDVMLDTSLVLEAETEAPAPETNVGDTETEIVPEAPAENSGVGTLPIIIVVAVIALAAIFFILRRKGEKEE